jgi:hypothetical protein
MYIYIMQYYHYARCIYMWVSVSMLICAVLAVLKRSVY